MWLCTPMHAPMFRSHWKTKEEWNNCLEVSDAYRATVWYSSHYIILLDILVWAPAINAGKNNREQRGQWSSVDPWDRMEETRRGEAGGGGGGLVAESAKGWRDVWKILTLRTGGGGGGSGSSWGGITQGLQKRLGVEPPAWPVSWPPYFTPVPSKT